MLTLTLASLGLPHSVTNTCGRRLLRRLGTRRPSFGASCRWLAMVVENGSRSETLLEAQG